MQRIVDAALVLIERADGAVLEMLDGDVLVGACAAGTLSARLGRRSGVADGLTGLAVRTGTAQRSDDTSTDRRANGEVWRRGTGSAIAVPLFNRGRTLGALTVTAPAPQALTEVHASALASLADFIATTIAGAEDVARQAQELLAGGQEGDPPGLSRFVADVLSPTATADVEARERIERVIRQRSMHMVYQPIVDLRDQRVSGLEALARFDGGGPPDAWFADAYAAGLGPELELTAVDMVVRALDEVPEDLYVGLNVSPHTASDPRLLALLDRCDSRRVVIELTEHKMVDDYPALLRVLTQARLRGARIAVDDTGSGYAGFSHILRLTPDVIKLDRILITGIHQDPVRQALAGGLVDVASATGADLVAEGVETRAELDTVEALGIESVQGYFLGRPAPLSQLAGTTRSVRRCLGAA